MATRASAANGAVETAAPKPVPANDSPETNGHVSDIDVAEDIKRMASKIQSITPLERVRDVGDASFEQKTHTLMMESVDRIITQWVSELQKVRENTKAVEEMVIAQAAKVKDELTRLHLLGVQAMREAERGHEVILHLGEQLDAMMTEHLATH